MRNISSIEPSLRLCGIHSNLKIGGIGPCYFYEYLVN